MEKKILVAEDDPDIAELVAIYLSGEGYAVRTVADGSDGLAALEEESFDLAVLDIMLPGLDGYGLTRKIREKSDLPILILSAKSEDNHKILGLNLGADDYMAKPFNPLELTARVKALLRRTERAGASPPDRPLRTGDLTLDRRRCLLRRGTREIPLTATEYKIMTLFMENPGRIFSKIRIAESIAGEYVVTDGHPIAVHISNLREKIGRDDAGKSVILTVKGLGYRIEDTTL